MQFLAKTNSFRKEKKNIPTVINWKVLGKHLDLSLEKAKSKSTRRETKFKHHSFEFVFLQTSKIS